MNIKYYCQKCGTQLQNSSSMAGETDRCPLCGFEHIVPLSKRKKKKITNNSDNQETIISTPQSPLSPRKTKDDSDTIFVICPCGSVQGFGRHMEGLQGRCHECGQLFQISSSTTDVPSAPIIPNDEECGDVYPLAEEPYEKKRSSVSLELPFNPRVGRQTAQQMYDDLPWYQRGGRMGLLAWMGLLFFGLAFIPLALVSLKGDIYYPPKKDDVDLRPWPTWNRIFFISAGLLICILLAKHIFAEYTKDNPPASTVPEFREGDKSVAQNHNPHKDQEIVDRTVNVVASVSDKNSSSDLMFSHTAGPDKYESPNNRRNVSKSIPANQQSLSKLDPASLYKQVRKAVVQVRVTTSEGDVITGTAFYVGEFKKGFDNNSWGVLVTNYHVVDDAMDIEITAYDEKKFHARSVIDTDKEHDLAILQVPGGAPNRLALSSTSVPEIGMKVYAIGNPFGLTASLSDGLISGHREIDPSCTVLQTSTPISHGSSGGPLLDEYGRVVGVTTLSLVTGQNLNFAVPTSCIRRLLEKKQRPFPIMLPREKGLTKPITPTQVPVKSKSIEELTLDDVPDSLVDSWRQAWNKSLVIKFEELQKQLKTLDEHETATKYRPTPRPQKGHRKWDEWQEDLKAWRRSNIERRKIYTKNREQAKKHRQCLVDERQRVLDIINRADKKTSSEIKRIILDTWRAREIHQRKWKKLKSEWPTVGIMDDPHALINFYATILVRLGVLKGAKINSIEPQYDSRDEKRINGYVGYCTFTFITESGFVRSAEGMIELSHFYHNGLWYDIPLWKLGNCQYVEMTNQYGADKWANVLSADEWDIIEEKFIPSPKIAELIQSDPDKPDHKNYYPTIPERDSE